MFPSRAEEYPIHGLGFRIFFKRLSKAKLVSDSCKLAGGSMLNVRYMDP